MSFGANGPRELCNIDYRIMICIDKAMVCNKLHYIHCIDPDIISQFSAMIVKSMLAQWLVYFNSIRFNLDLLVQKYNNVNKYLF